MVWMSNSLFVIDIFALESRRFRVKTQALYKVWEALNEAGYVLPGEIIELKNYHNQTIMVDTNIKTSESR
jgi:small conductance mechanosensitive channel